VDDRVELRDADGEAKGRSTRVNTTRYRQERFMKEPDVGFRAQRFKACEKRAAGTDSLLARYDAGTSAQPAPTNQPT
jgi:hypothetical protein